LTEPERMIGVIAGVIVDPLVDLAPLQAVVGAEAGVGHDPQKGMVEEQDPRGIEKETNADHVDLITEGGVLLGEQWKAWKQPIMEMVIAKSILATRTWIS